MLTPGSAPPAVDPPVRMPAEDPLMEDTPALESSVEDQRIQNRSIEEDPDERKPVKGIPLGRRPKSQPFADGFEFSDFHVTFTTPAFPLGGDTTFEVILDTGELGTFEAIVKVCVAGTRPSNNGIARRPCTNHDASCT